MGQPEQTISENLTSEQAEQLRLIGDNVIQPAFFEKFATWGLEPRNDAEAEKILQLGFTLLQQERTGQLKTADDPQAGDAGGFLDAVLAKVAAESQASPEAISTMIDQGARQLVSQNPQLKQAALLMADVMATAAAELSVN